MAAPSFVAAGNFNSTNSADLTVISPGGHASGDYEVLMVESADQAVALLTANGFTQHPGSPVICDNATLTIATRLTLFERIYTGQSDPVLDFVAQNHIIGQILAFRRSTGTWSTLSDVRSDVDGTGWKASPEKTEDTSLSWTGLTTDTNDQRIIMLVAQAKPDIVGGTAEMSAHTNANLAGIAEHTDDADNIGNGGWMGSWSGTLATAGATGTSTATGATASYHACMMLAIRDSAPAAAPGPAGPQPRDSQRFLQRRRM